VLTEEEKTKLATFDDDRVAAVGLRASDVPRRRIDLSLCLLPPLDEFTGLQNGLDHGLSQEASAATCKKKGNKFSVKRDCREPTHSKFIGHRMRPPSLHSTRVTIKVCRHGLQNVCSCARQDHCVSSGCTTAKQMLQKCRFWTHCWHDSSILPMSPSTPPVAAATSVAVLLLALIPCEDEDEDDESVVRTVEMVAEDAD